MTTALVDRLALHKFRLLAIHNKLNALKAAPQGGFISFKTLGKTFLNEKTAKTMLDFIGNNISADDATKLLANADKLQKFNEHHDAHGRFASAEGVTAGGSKVHDVIAGWSEGKTSAADLSNALDDYLKREPATPEQKASTKSFIGRAVETAGNFVKGLLAVTAVLTAAAGPIALGSLGTALTGSPLPLMAGLFMSPVLTAAVASAVEKHMVSDEQRQNTMRDIYAAQLIDFNNQPETSEADRVKITQKLDSMGYIIVNMGALGSFPMRKRT